MPPSPHSSPSSAPPLPSSGGGGGGRWGPYSSSSEFDINMATILVILVLATIVAFTLHATLRFLLRLYRRSPPPPSHSSQQHKQHKHYASSLANAMPTLVFSPETQLTGGDVCAICLTEFAQGVRVRVRVLKACNHGFHVTCVEGWLVSKSSCPTCRGSCRPAVAEP